MSFFLKNHFFVVFSNILALNLIPMNRKFALPLLAICAGLVLSCNKDNKQVPVQILLTDNPIAYDKVNVEITGIQVKMSNDTSGWVSLDTEKGIYNLLALQNGLTDTIAKGNVPDGILKEVRFVLGS